MFFAQWQHVQLSMQSTLEAFSLADGHPMGAVTMLPACTNPISGPFRARDGAFWYVVSTGPRLRSDLAGGDPAPNSCSGTLIRLNPTTRTQTVEWKAPASELIDAPVPSPDGKEVAYLAGGCDTSYFNMHIEVRNLATGHEWAIGGSATPCHGLSEPSWSADGSKLLFTFAPSVLSPNTTFVPHGGCEAPAPGELAIVPSNQPAEITAQDLTAASPGCGYQYAVFDHEGIAASEACGENDLGPAYLVQLDAHLVAITRVQLPSGGGTTLAADPMGKFVLVDAHEGEQSKNGQEVGPYDWIEVFDGHQLRLIARTNYFSSAISWATF